MLPVAPVTSTERFSSGAAADERGRLKIYESATRWIRPASWLGSCHSMMECELPLRC